MNSLRRPSSRVSKHKACFVACNMVANSKQSCVCFLYSTCTVSAVARDTQVTRRHAQLCQTRGGLEVHAGGIQVCKRLIRCKREWRALYGGRGRLDVSDVCLLAVVAVVGLSRTSDADRSGQDYCYLAVAINSNQWLGSGGDLQRCLRR